MKVMLQQFGPGDPREVRQGFRDWLLGLYLGAIAAAIPGRPAEIVLVSGARIGGLDLHKVDKALGEPTESCA